MVVMSTFNITYSVVLIKTAFKFALLGVLFCSLSACLGGTIAQQIARSIATSVADKVVANAMDKQYEKDNAPKNTVLKDTPPDPYKIAFVNAGFEPVQAIAEPLPQTTEEIDAPIAIAQSSQLVRVELFNLLLGEEKAAVYEKARILGATTLPKLREWQNWNVATGLVTSDLSSSSLVVSNLATANSKTGSQKNKKVITFLIPPEFGKLPSGSIAVVEIASSGELNIARYKVN